MAAEYLLEMNNIVKDYFGNKVLKGVTIKVRAGEIHALVGENGAGKSTLMNILFGMPVIYSTGGIKGEVVLEGKPVTIESPKTAMNLGIGMVHQEFMLLPGFTITENIKLNRETTKHNPVSKVLGNSLKSLDILSMRKDAQKALKTLGMNVDDWLPIAGLPVGYMQFVEIAREIDKENIRLLVFDEPTAVLAESEADKLLETMKILAAQGIAILFITHRLDEVLAVADAITVLRDGTNVGCMTHEEANLENIAEMMIGKNVERLVPTAKDVQSQEVALSIRNLSVTMPGEMVKNIDLDVKKGEVLGLAGLAGQGKIGVANGVMGLYPATGEVFKGESRLELNNPKKAIQNKLAFVSEDRRGVGLLLDTSIELNIMMTSMQIQGKFLKAFLGIKAIQMADNKKIREHALKMIKELDIRCTDPTQITRRLSGGNQQKVCVARALTLEPNILFVSEPTRGIDIGAKKLLLDLLVKLNREWGMTIVVTSSELGELRSICDRIAVVYGGKIETILSPTAPDVDYGLAMAGKYSDREETV
ncbi:sugar ABC transporter ATP-binding protein [Sporomusa acidovorans]|uniref:Xylose import ATP-binding protein XylG n=1 Tax=Sporomusa acidovorans (strain ATCC 49682 / DSM 3132 / Mol) TaxID=1123286 RepID=A0ABZ3JC05_SPOA4|nr:sugar ABC transporter ATP-binding protein [Sporomusa acidovorans]OZC13334.1 xylose import ATP-binding protein XylG [Sporomusa acidovorans DSM 3132]SDD96124.1 monosaccharide ABC transporter ATP-binding protein, CUT2 family [Sporomusa acidovorans]